MFTNSFRNRSRVGIREGHSEQSIALFPSISSIGEFDSVQAILTFVRWPSNVISGHLPYGRKFRVFACFRAVNRCVTTANTRTTGFKKFPKILRDQPRLDTGHEYNTKSEEGAPREAGQEGQLLLDNLVVRKEVFPRGRSTAGGGTEKKKRKKK